MKQKNISLRLYRNATRLLLGMMLAIFAGTAYAQTGSRTISGIVLDDMDYPLPGAHVSIVKVHPTDAVQAVATDVNGHFTLTFPNNVKAITVSYIGFKMKTVTLTTSNDYKIKLDPDTETMEEVVVNGAFTRKANTFTGAVTTVKGEDLQRVGNQNVLQSLKNIDPSFLQIENLAAGSNPNALPDFQMRGSSSVGSLQGEFSSSANQPLFILDGFETDLTKILDLDMNQVESLTTLKDATAKAIYGAKAANGVIVIETKRPSSGRLKVSYNGGLSIEAPDLTSYDLCNALEKLEVEKMAGLFESDNALTQINLDKTYTNKLREILAGSDTDWKAQPTRVGVGHKHSVLLEGGDDSMLYGVDLSYNNIEGVMKGSNRNTFSGGVTLSYRVKDFIFRNKLTIDYNDSNNSPYGTFDMYCRMNPYSRLHDENGNLVKSYSYTDASGEVGDYYNPLYNTTLNTKDNTGYTTITNNFYAEWQATQSLRLTARLGYVRQTSTADLFKPANHTDFANENDAYYKGSYKKTNGTSTNLSADLGASYSIQLNKHLFFFNGQLNMTDQSFLSNTWTAEGFPNDFMDDISFGAHYEKDGRPNGSESVSRSVGGLLSLNYSYDEKYLFDANYRLQASSETSKDNRWGHFWSVGAGWNIHNEGFLKDLDIFNTLKLRASYGFTGNQSANSFAATPMFQYISGLSYNGSIGSQLASLANPALKWEEKYDTNIGLDFALFNKRLNGRFDYYQSTTDGQVTAVTVPTSTGFSSYTANLGKVENKGFEAYLNYRVYESKRDYINIYGSLAQNKNTLKELSDGLRAWNEEQDKEMIEEKLTTPMVKFYEGCSMNAIWAVKSLGIDPQNGKEIFVKKDGSVTYEYDTADQVVCGDTQPKFNGLFGFNGEIKGFGFSVAANYRWGGQMYNSTLVDKVENAPIQYNVDHRVFTDRWQQPGDIALYKAISDQSTTYPTSRFVEDYNMFTLSSLSIYYDFYNCKFLKDSFLQRLKVSAYTNDLFIISSVKTERGTSYPFSRTFSFSVQATF